MLIDLNTSVAVAVAKIVAALRKSKLLPLNHTASYYSLNTSLKAASALDQDVTMGSVLIIGDHGQATNTLHLLKK